MATWLTAAGVLLPRIGRLPGAASTDGAIALTVDDGPTPETTPVLIESLAARGARATFFLAGERAEQHPELVRALVESGHEVYAHGYEHHPFDDLDRSAIVGELERAEAVLRRARRTPSPYLVRLPFMSGHGSYRVHRAVRRWNRRSVFVDWSLSTDDWQIAEQCTDVADVDDRCRAAVARVMAAPHLGGAIVVLHDVPFDAPGGMAAAVTVALLPRLLAALSDQGVRVVGVGEAIAAAGNRRRTRRLRR